jgi:hypothetical protein
MGITIMRLLTPFLLSQGHNPHAIVLRSTCVAMGVPMQLPLRFDQTDNFICLFRINCILR